MIARATRAPVELPAPNVVFFFSQHSSSDRRPPIPLRPTFTVLTIPERKLGRNLLRFVKFTTRFYNTLPFFPSFFFFLSLSLPSNVSFINRYVCFLYALLFQSIALNYVYNRSQKSPCILCKLYSNESCYNRN